MSELFGVGLVRATNYGDETEYVSDHMSLESAMRDYVLRLFSTKDRSITAIVVTNLSTGVDVRVGRCAAR